ncbi:hypothetical protein HPB49_000540 [Dermacentor silvarum]|uniref:Uncharacterized protein n=1 Tax=Dermacentor silvarum TaxID=543639 RepID=A0ACB8DLX1_DERSI|nr:uncharacterized protein LOC125940627 [Dermacentor silvarum]KAH7973386.1 hypothetical protein HPB49_000540 [Dermacentor silvarum]
MSSSEYTLTGFSDFLEHRSVTFVNPLPNIRVCGVCGIVPARTLLLSCGQVFCEPCRAQIKGRELCPFHDEDCLEADVVVLDFKLSQLDKHVVLCPSGENCAFTGPASALKEHLVNCSSEKVKCPKCSQPVIRNVAVDHRRRCSRAADPGQEASKAETDSDVIPELQDIRMGLKRLLDRELNDELDKDYVVNNVNLLVKRLALLERDCKKVQRHPVGRSQKGKSASTMKRPPLAATPYRAASSPNVFVSVCSFDVYEKVESLKKNGNDSIMHAPSILGGYFFQLECVFNKDKNGRVTVAFAFSLGEGKLDGRLFWPFSSEVAVILSHPTDSERDIRLPVSLPDHEMAKKPAPGTWNEGNTTEKVSWKDVAFNGFVDGGSIYVNVELA